MRRRRRASQSSEDESQKNESDSNSNSESEQETVSNQAPSKYEEEGEFQYEEEDVDKKDRKSGQVTENPSVVPKSGKFFMHDNRDNEGTPKSEEDKEGEEEETEETVWLHDKYDTSDKKSKGLRGRPANRRGYVATRSGEEENKPQFENHGRTHFRGNLSANNSGRYTKRYLHTRRVVVNKGNETKITTTFEQKDKNEDQPERIVRYSSYRKKTDSSNPTNNNQNLPQENSQPNTQPNRQRGSFVPRGRGYRTQRKRVEYQPKGKPETSEAVNNTNISNNNNHNHYKPKHISGPRNQNNFHHHGTHIANNGYSHPQPVIENDSTPRTEVKTVPSQPPSTITPYAINAVPFTPMGMAYTLPPYPYVMPPEYQYQFAGYGGYMPTPMGMPVNSIPTGMQYNPNQYTYYPVTPYPNQIVDQQQQKQNIPMGKKSPDNTKQTQWVQKAVPVQPTKQRSFAIPIVNPEEATSNGNHQT